MKIAVFDCAMGIAGDMAIGALVDAGMPFRLLGSELRKLRLRGYRLGVRTVHAGAFRAKKFSVNLQHQKSHAHVCLRDIVTLIQTSALHPRIKRSAVAIFRSLARAEARVHGVSLQKIHFHEVGAVDSILDIVGVAVCFHHLEIQRAYVRRIVVGQGVHAGCAHGEMPIPVPGTYELLKGFWIDQGPYEQEMVTPTGAAILATLCCKDTEKIPRIKFDAIGYGAGDRKFKGKRGFLRVGIGAGR
ncbi:MAG: LarC family nickel insertion protein [Candidatus Omnitrophota bacterium]|nr:LarC family nickel insertion protein [Candidatus Omnitrophota bacterium]